MRPGLLILATGSGVAIPPGAQIVDVTGKEIIPGIIDNHSHIGFPIQDANESPQSFVPQIRAFEMLDPNEHAYFRHPRVGIHRTLAPARRDRCCRIRPR